MMAQIINLISQFLQDPEVIEMIYLAIGTFIMAGSFVFTPTALDDSQEEPEQQEAI